MDIQNFHISFKNHYLKTYKTSKLELEYTDDDGQILLPCWKKSIKI